MNQPENLNLIYTIFCEDVRWEASNHFSLMGVMHQLIVPQMPVTLIKFAVVTHWRGEGQFLNEVRILAPDRSQPIALSQPASFVVSADGYADNVTVFINTTFFQPGKYIIQTLINSSLYNEQEFPVIMVNQQQVTESEQIN